MACVLLLYPFLHPSPALCTRLPASLPVYMRKGSPIVSVNAARRDGVFVVCASVSWGTVGLVNQLLYGFGATNALSLAFLRLVIALPLFVLAGLVTLRAHLFHIQWRDLCTMLLMGSLLALSQACYVAAIASAGVSVSTLIAICAAPVGVAMLETMVTRVRPTPMTLLALASALSGTALLVAGRTPTGGGRVSLAGVVLASLAAGGYGGFVFCGRWLTSRYHPLQISSVAFGAGTLLLLVCASSTGLMLAYPVDGWLLLLYLGIVPTAIGYGLFQIGIRSLSATMASILTMCEPLTAAILARVLLGEELGMLGLLGAGCMLGAMAIILYAPRRYAV